MRKLLSFCLLLTYAFTHAQNVGIGTTTPLSKLHVAGDLRIDSLAVHKDTGVVIHDKNGVLASLKFTGNKSDVLRGDGSFASWNAPNAASAGWLTAGNAGTDPSLNFLGTTDEQPLKFRINNGYAGELDGANKNVALGTGSFSSNQSGYNNVVIGNGALHNMIRPDHVVAIGDSALFSQVEKEEGHGPASNTAIGSKALFSTTTGVLNIGIGFSTLYGNTSGGRNIAIGHNALISNTIGSSNIAIGVLSMLRNISGVSNVAVGDQNLMFNTTGTGNTSCGSAALALNTSGGFNTALGVASIQGNTTGSWNTAAGVYSLLYNASGSNNSAFGTNSMYNNKTGIDNTSAGESSLYKNINGNYNIAIGRQSLYSNTTSYNTALGYKSAFLTRGGTFNTASGYMALYSNVYGAKNTAVGAYSDVTSGDLVNATAIGYYAKVNASNKVRIGNAAVTKIEGQVPFSTPSDGRYKFNVKEDVQGLSFILKLRPVTYQFDVKRFDGEGGAAENDVLPAAYASAAAIRRTGFIAQEVEMAADKAGYLFSGISKPVSASDHYALSYESFVVPLVKGMQEQQQIILYQQKTIESLIQRIEALEKNKDKQ